MRLAGFMGVRMKVDLDEIEGLSINEQFYGMDCRSVILTPNEVNAMIRVVRAAKELKEVVNGHILKVSRDELQNHHFDLLDDINQKLTRALSKIEFGDTK